MLDDKVVVYVIADGMMSNHFHSGLPTSIGYRARDVRQPINSDRNFAVTDIEDKWLLYQFGL